MTQEEKAKAYDEAINRMKHYVVDEYGCSRIKVADVFPELAESEDERIRKALIDGFTVMKESKNCGKTFSNHNIPVADILAWLEKQGEQKPDIKYVYPKFRVGDTIVEKEPNGSCPPVIVKYIGEGHYSCNSSDNKRYLSFPIAQEDEYELAKQKSAWSEEDEEHLNSIISDIKTDMGAYPRSQEVIDIYNDDISFLKSLKDRVQPQPKQEWGEDDENEYNHIIKTLTLFAEEQKTKGYNNLIGSIDWFKSLKDRVQPQSHWKPSNEQMTYIQDAISKYNEFSNEYTGLVKLYNDLKKLKGE